VELAATLLEEDDVFGATEPERLYEPPAFGELLGERVGYLRVRGRDEDRVEGRVHRQALAPVADDDMDVLASGEPGAGVRRDRRSARR
jgi:hypothetical protein